MNYYIRVNGEKRGPYTISELKSREITENTEICEEGTDNWEFALNNQELRENIFWHKNKSENNEVEESTEIPEDHDIKAEETTVAVKTEEHEIKEQPSNTSNKSVYPIKQVKKSYIAIGIAALILLALCFTRPDKSAHKEALQEVFNEVIDEKIESQGDILGGFDMIGKMIGHTLVERTLNEIVDYHNYVLFSTTTIEDRLNNKEKTVSFGILGHVFTFDKEDIEKSLEFK